MLPSPRPVLALLAILLLAAAPLPAADPAIQHWEPIKREAYTTAPNEAAVDRITITNRHGLIARIITWGATLTEMHVPDRNGKVADVTLGFDEAERWVQPHPVFGSTIGRYANRIGGAQFSLDGQVYKLTPNNGKNSIHGGPGGFARQNWTIDKLTADSVRLVYVSRDGEEGFPGNLTVALTYTLTEKNELRLDYEASTDKPTVINLTNHAYWNLSGGAAPTIAEHELKLAATQFTEVDAEQIPTGKFLPAEGPMDFQKLKKIGPELARLEAAGQSGFDHNYVVTDWKEGVTIPVAEVRDPASGRRMEVSTSQPGVQFYTANGLADLKGKRGATYGKHAALCLETQHFPDSPNQKAFPSTVLSPKETFRSTTIHRFSAE